jgi:uncharacterized membrane protein
MDEESLMTLVLRMHAITGGVSLVVAPLAMVVRKGGDWHRLWGKVFFYGMAVVCITAIIAGSLRPNYLMALVAIFSFHMIASGYRALYLKRLHQGQRPGRLDHLLHGTAGLINAGLFLWGVSHLMLGHRDTASIIFTAFGTIGLLMVWAQLRRFHKANHDKREWFFAHMTGFLGGYIATVSAFSAVNLAMIRPVWLQWLWPTLVGAPLIALWVRYYRTSFEKGRRMHDMTDIRIR